MLSLGWKAAAFMATVALGAGAWGAWEAKKADRALTARDEAIAARVATQGELNNCAARILNIQEAQDDEDHFNGIPDDGLGDDIPDHWLFPPGSGPAAGGD